MNITKMSLQTVEKDVASQAMRNQCLKQENFMQGRSYNVLGP